MTKRNFLLASLLALICFGVANVLMAKWSNRTPARRKVEYIHNAKGANVVLIGNSLLDGAVLPTVFADTAKASARPANLSELNAALGACEPPEQYLLFRLAERDARIPMVVIGFFDFQLTKTTVTKTSDLTGNRALSFDPRIDAKDAESIYHFTGLDRLEFRVFRTLPLLGYRSQTWKYVELLRRALSQIGTVAEASNSWGRVSDFNALEAPDIKSFNRQADRFTNAAFALNEPIQRIVSESNAHNYQLIFLLMPISPFHRANFYAQRSWRIYLDGLKRWASTHKIAFIDASEWFLSEEDFGDRLHLASKSHYSFTRRLASTIASLSGEAPLAAVTRPGK